jgi:peptide/nickel transport system permease protein
VIGFLARRVGHGLLVMLATVLVLFCLICVVPGDPASVVLGPHASLAQKAALRAEMGLDLPVPVQFFRFLWRILHGDLGRDVLTHQPVAGLLLHALPHTLALTAAGIGWAIALGVPLGCFCALGADGWADRVVGVVSAAAIALPTSLVAIYALLLFAVTLHWFPAIGVGREGDPVDALRHLALPSLALGLGGGGGGGGVFVPADAGGDAGGADGGACAHVSRLRDRAGLDRVAVCVAAGDRAGDRGAGRGGGQPAFWCGAGGDGVRSAGAGAADV